MSLIVQSMYVNNFEIFEFRNAELSQDVLLPMHTNKTLGDAQKVYYRHVLILNLDTSDFFGFRSFGFYFEYSMVGSTFLFFIFLYVCFVPSSPRCLPRVS